MILSMTRSQQMSWTNRQMPPTTATTTLNTHPNTTMGEGTDTGNGNVIVGRPDNGRGRVCTRVRLADIVRRRHCSVESMVW